MTWMPTNGLPTSDAPGDRAGAPCPPGRGDVQRPTAQVIPLPRPGARRFRRGVSPAEGPGRILLFTGVRYERMPDPVRTVPPRQRRHS